MPVFVTGKVKHVNGRDAVVDAEDIQLTDGKRLDAAMTEQGNMTAATAKRVVELGVELDQAKADFGNAIQELNVAYPVLPGAAVLEPEKFYDFGSVSELAVALAQRDDGKAHEYWFRFEPQEEFLGLSLEPEVRWVADPQFPVGKTCTVGVCMGMAVMAVV